MSWEGGRAWSGFISCCEQFSFLSCQLTVVFKIVNFNAWKGKGGGNMSYNCTNRRMELFWAARNKNYQKSMSQHYFSNLVLVPWWVALLLQAKTQQQAFLSAPDFLPGAVLSAPCITATVTGRPLKPAGGGRPIFRARQSKYMGARPGQMTSSIFKDIFSRPFGWEIEI